MVRPRRRGRECQGDVPLCDNFLMLDRVMFGGVTCGRRENDARIIAVAQWVLDRSYSKKGRTRHDVERDNESNAGGAGAQPPHGTGGSG